MTDAVHLDMGNDTRLGERLRRDPLALLAVVYEAAAAREPEPQVVAALRANADAVLAAPKGSLPEHLLAIMGAADPALAVRLLSSSGLMTRLLPEVEGMRHMPNGQGRHKDVYQHTLIVVSRVGDDPLTRFAALLHDIGKPATKVVENGVVHFPGHAELGADMTRRRLRALGFDKATNEALTTLVALHLRANSYEDDWTDAATRRLAREAGDQWARLLDLSRADVTSGRREVVERALRRVEALRERYAAIQAADDKPVSPIDGNELMALFERPPGRWIGQIKDHLAALVGAGTLAPDDRETALRIARTLLSEESLRV